MQSSVNYEYQLFKDSFKQIYGLLRFFDSELNRSKIKTNREDLAQAILTKIAYDIDSLIQILPDFGGNDQFLLNVTTPYSLSRIIIESIAVLYHVCLEEVDLEESDFRISLYKYHGEMQRKRITEKIKSEVLNDMRSVQEQEKLKIKRSELENNIESLKQHLENHNFFLEQKFLSPKLDYTPAMIKNIKKQIFKGQKHIYIELDEILNELSENFDKIYAIYMQNSSHIHCHKYTLDQILRQNLDPYSSFNSLTTIINYLSLLILKIMHKYHQFFKPFLPNLSSQQIAILNGSNLPLREIK